MTDSENRIRIHEGSIVLPNGFEDRTTNLFVPADTAAQPNLSVARDWLKDGETLAPYIDRQIALLKSRLQGHRVLSRQTERLGPETDGMPGSASTLPIGTARRPFFNGKAHSSLPQDAC